MPKSQNAPQYLEPKHRSRAYPAIALPEAIELLRRWGPESDVAEGRDVIAKWWGYAGGNSGIAGRKIAALVHFGLLSLSEGRYSRTPLAQQLQDAGDPKSLRAALRQAFLCPRLFRDIIQRYELTGRVQSPLPEALTTHHGIQRAVSDEVARIFMASARYASILDADGRFRPEYFEETGRPVLVQGKSSTLAFPDQPLEDEETASKESARDRQRLRFLLTEEKEAEIRVPVRLNEHDIQLLRLQIDYLELQVQLNRPDPPRKFAEFRERRSK